MRLHRQRLCCCCWGVSIGLLRKEEKRESSGQTVRGLQQQQTSRDVNTSIHFSECVDPSVDHQQHQQHVCSVLSFLSFFFSCFEEELLAQAERQNSSRGAGPAAHRQKQTDSAFAREKWSRAQLNPFESIASQSDAVTRVSERGKREREFSKDSTRVSEGRQGSKWWTRAQRAGLGRLGLGVSFWLCVLCKWLAVKCLIKSNNSCWWCKVGERIKHCTAAALLLPHFITTSVDIWLAVTLTHFVCLVDTFMH